MPPNPPPYVGLSVQVVHPLSRLHDPPYPSINDFPACIPRYRLNLLSTDDIHLYFAHSITYLSVYRIVRSNGLSLQPVASLPLPQPTTINNTRTLKSSLAGPLLLLAGGQERPSEPASLSFLHLPTARTDCDGFWKTSQIRLRRFRHVSAWGLDVYHDHARQEESIAFSNNSRRVVQLSAANLLLFDQDLYLTAPLVQPAVHDDNIPCVAFSPDGELLASASIDGTFAIYESREGGGILYRSGRPEARRWSDMASAKMRCWMVHWVRRRAVVAVARRDHVWTQRMRQRRWHGGGPFARCAEMGVRESLFDCMEGASGGDEGPVLPLYDDGGGDGMLDWIGSLHCGGAGGNERKENNDGRGSQGRCRVVLGGPGNEKDRTGADLEERQKGGQRVKAADNRESGVETEDGGVEFQVDYEGCESEDGKKGCMDGEDKDDDYRLLLVGRQGQLILYQVKDIRRTSAGKSGEQKKLLVEEFDRITFETEGELWSSGWPLKAEEIVSLGALAIAITGLGVVILRVLKGKANEKLFVDKLLKMGPMQEVPSLWEPRTQIAGMCVVEREGANDSSGYPVELWVVWLNGMVKCWEIWREGGVIDNSICV